MLYNISHTTVYNYGEMVPECFNLVRLNPRPVFDQSCLEHRLDISPQPDDLAGREDFFGNRIEQFSVHEPHDQLSVTAINRVDVTARDYPAMDSTPPWEMVAAAIDPTDIKNLQFNRSSSQVRITQPIRQYALQSFSPGRPIALAAMDLTRRIHEDFEFDPLATTVSTPIEDVFQKKAGVCQDFAHLQIACFRSLGLPARYVSGYIRTNPPAGQPRLAGADASHAWVSVFAGEHGWFDFDPTNNLMPATDHITIAWGRDYFDVCPIQGVFTGGGRTLMTVSVDVIPESD